jgi:DNA-binding NtrC family response regulator
MSGTNSSKSVLVVEDEYFIAEVLCEAFAMNDWTVIGPYSDLERATTALEQGVSADVAILDVNLKGEVVFPLVDLLSQTDTAIVLTTGYGRAEVPKKYAHLPQMMKPVSVRDLIEAADQALGRRHG